METRGAGPGAQAEHTKRYLAAIHAEQDAYADELEASGGYRPAIEAIRAKRWRFTRGHAATLGCRAVPRPSKSAFAPASWVAWTDVNTGAARRGVVVGPVERWSVSIVPADGGDVVSAVRRGDGVFLDGMTVVSVDPPE
ncbi:hypothetical protein [Embleya scabrispora]|uniref:hypothetical protein n=1 Tax=Embleya scabrispora TaxID=159449 RepID=UPI001180006E|nr:hypothetical protein [Embleya scabrispora]